MTGAADDARVAPFEEHRRTLVGAAYRVLGSVADAEDVVQEVWLRWAEVDQDTVDDPRAYLLTITTRLALNRLRAQRARREAYVGPWLPEPLVTTDDDPRLSGPAAVELADSVSMAMLVVLETLSPLERAAFVLREVFDLPFAEVARALDRSEAASRQLATRARSHVRARQPRHRVDARRHREVTEGFLQAIAAGDLERCLAFVAPDVALVSDGGGLRRAALRPILGAEKVLRFLLATSRDPEQAGAEAAVRLVNGEPAIVIRNHGVVDSVGFLTVEEEGITAIHIVRNPEKLAAVSP